jgi:hypothetical protein
LILIEEQGKPRKVEAPAPVGLDLLDFLLAGGVLSAEAAAAIIWWPAVLILAALFCFGWAYLICNPAVFRRTGK